MTTWFERRPGSEETLIALYDVVAAAEELDLWEQAAEEAVWAEFWRLDANGFVAWRIWDEFAGDGETAEDNESVEEPDDDLGERPSMSQAVGIIEHLLGGHTLP